MGESVCVWVGGWCFASVRLCMDVDCVYRCRDVVFLSVCVQKANEKGGPACMHALPPSLPPSLPLSVNPTPFHVMVYMSVRMSLCSKISKRRASYYQTQPPTTPLPPACTAYLLPAS